MADEINDNQFTITVNEKILLHLKDFSSYREEKEIPKALTQKGIAGAIGILPSHIPRALKRLIKDDLVIERDGYVEGSTRKSRVYFLSENGVERTKRLAERVGALEVAVKKDGKLLNIPLCEVNMHLRNKLTLIELCLQHQLHRTIDLNRLESGQKIVVFSRTAPKMGIFIDREKDIDALTKCIENCNVTVVFGVRGVGKTALATKYLESLRGKQSIFWYQLHQNDTLIDILQSLAEFLEMLGVKSLSEYLKGGKTNMAESLLQLFDTLSETGTILIFDNYTDRQGEDIADFFTMLVNMIRETKGVKVLITAREDIPYYSWFYGKKELERCTVGEIHMKGLDRESGKQLLNVPEIEDDAYKQIYQLTRGVPQLILYLRNNDMTALKETGMFTAQEIRHMLSLTKVLKK